MTREEAFAIWAPSGGVWTPWAKAVIFAHFDLARYGHEQAVVPSMPWISDLKNTAVVADLPGALGIDVGLALAARGFRPVPLYNAVPSGTIANETVDVRSILNALISRTNELQTMRLPFDAPPAFLLDARRRGAGAFGNPGSFDNRSICFPTDFPSATFLANQGIASALLLSADRIAQADLSHILRRWQEAGIRILSAAPEDDQPREIDVPVPSWFKSLWYGWLTALGLRRNLLGGFGGNIPYPGHGG